MRRSYWPAEPLRPGNSQDSKLKPWSAIGAGLSTSLIPQRFQSDGANDLSVAGVLSPPEPRSTRRINGANTVGNLT